MYTVVRFIAGAACSDTTLTELGAQLNEITAGIFKRLDHAGRRFSISVSSAEDWNVHVNEVLHFLKNMAPVIAKGRARGVSVVADIAVEPEDLDDKPYLVLELSPFILGELVQHDVGAVFTFCGPGSTP